MPIKLIVPASVGGGPHSMAQIVSQEASKILGQPIIVEARSGGSGIPGTKDIINATPDGYSILFADSSSYAISPHLYRNIKFEPLNALKAVTPVANIPLVLAVNPSLQVSTVNEFLALAKAKPGLLCGTSGNGTPHHLSMELLKSLAKIDVQCVPYRGSAPVSLAIAAGDVSVGFLGLQAARPLAESGKIKMLAVSTGFRLHEIPDVPTLAEAGVPGFQLSTTVGVFVPLRTPSEIVTKLHDAFNRAAKTDFVRDRRSALGFVAAADMLPEEYMKFALEEYAKYGELVRDTKAYVN
jgi:tripartite-type tricarboxylate transporter receptor subunit TctC